MSRHVYQSKFADGQGRIIPSATVSVYLAGTATAANVYAAATGGSPVTSVTTASDGSFSFFVSDSDFSLNQKFKITMTKTDFATKSYDNITIFAPVPTGIYYPDANATDQGAATTGGYSLKDIIDAAGSNNITIKFRNSSGSATTSYTLTTSETIPSTCAIELEQGAMIVQGGSATLTINGPLVGNPMHQWLNGFAAGEVVFNYNKINILHGPEFYIRHGQECGGAINEMLQAAYLPASGSTPDYDINGRASIKVELPTGIFLTNEVIVVPPMVELIGSSRMGTMIVANNVSANPVIDFSNSTSQPESLLKSITINGNDKGVVGIRLSDGVQSQHNFITIDNIYVTRCTTSIAAEAGSGKYIIYTKIKNSRFNSATARHILLDHGVNYMEITGNNFFDALPYDIEFAATFAGDHVIIDGNSFDDSVTTASISVKAVSGNGALNAIIRNNRIEQGGTSIGVNVASAYATAHIIGNYFASILTPISISGKSCIVDANHFQGAPATATHAIIINSGAQFNSITNTNKYGEPNSNYPKRITDNGTATQIQPYIHNINDYAAVGTYHEKGDMLWDDTPSAGGSMGAMCVTAGSYGSYSTTGSITINTATLTVASVSGATPGMHITIAGISGVKKVLNISGLTLTLDTNADATVSGAAVNISNPVYKAMPNLAS